MLQKYMIQRDKKSGNLTIEEKAVIDPIPRGSDINQLNEEVFSLLYSITHSQEKIESAIEKGKPGVIAAIRNSNFFPTQKHSDAIADAIIRVYNGNEASVEVCFNACDLFETTEAAVGEPR